MATAAPKKTRSTKPLKGTRKAAFPPSEEEADADKESLLQELEKLRTERDKYKALADSSSETKSRLLEAQARVAHAKGIFEEADAARKKARLAVDEAIANELLLVARWTSGEQCLPFPADEQSASDTRTATVRSPLDIGAQLSLSQLGVKPITELIGAEEVARLKTIGEPVGLSDKEVDLLVSAGLNTVGELEERMRKSEWWHRDIPGLGETKINKLLNTHRVFRSKYPLATEPDSSPAPTTGQQATAAPAATAPPPDTGEWEQAVYHLKEVIAEAQQLTQTVEAEAQQELAEVVEKAGLLIGKLEKAKAINAKNRDWMASLVAQVAKHRKAG